MSQPGRLFLVAYLCTPANAESLVVSQATMQKDRQAHTFARTHACQHTYAHACACIGASSCMTVRLRHDGKQECVWAKLLHAATQQRQSSTQK